MKRGQSRRTFLRLGAVSAGLGTAGCSAIEALSRSKGSDATWPMFQHDAANTGYSPDKGPRADVSARWRFKTEGGQQTSTWPPAVVDGTVYVGGDWLYALDAKTGTKQWQKPLGRPAPPAIVDNIVVVPRTAPRWRLTGLAAVSGEQLWELDIGFNGYSWPTVADETVYIGGGSRDSRSVYAVDLTTGVERWRFPVERVVGTPAVVDGTVFVGDRGRGPDDANEPTFYALDALSGDELWRIDLDYLWSPAVVDGRVFVCSGAIIYALDAATGEIEWTVTRNLDRGAVMFPAIADETLYVTGTDVAAYDIQDGTQLWQAGREMKGLFPTLTEDTLYATDGAGTLHALSTSGGQSRWTYDVASPQRKPRSTQRGSAPAISGETAYVMGVSGSVYALEEG